MSRYKIEFSRDGPSFLGTVLSAGTNVMLHDILGEQWGWCCKVTDGMTGESASATAKTRGEAKELAFNALHRRNDAFFKSRQERRFAEQDRRQKEWEARQRERERKQKEWEARQQERERKHREWEARQREHERKQQEWRERMQAKVDRLEEVLRNKEQYLDRLDNQLDGLRDKRREAKSDSFRDKVEEWIDQTEDKMAQVKSQISDIESKIREIRDRLD